MSTRRNLLGAGAGLLALAGFAAGAAKADELDGELLARCAGFCAIHAARDRQAELDGEAWPSAAHEALAGALSEALRDIAVTIARTPAGVIAKARVARIALIEYSPPENPDVALVQSLIRDILGRGGVA